MTQVQPVSVSQVQRVETVAPVSGYQQEIIEEYERPQYQRLYNNQRVEERRQAPLHDEEVKKSGCCGFPCWALLGLLGLIGLVLGLLFGLGVIGGLRGSGNANVDGNAGGNVVDGTVIGNMTYPNNTIII